MDERRTFLMEMYRQMFNDINRHIMVVWQSIGVVVGAFAIFALVEKKVLSLDFASSIIVLLCGWLFAHLIDAGYWYNRNLVIIANIERQFLTKNDLKEIHYYFGKHRPKNRMITHLKIQTAFGLGLVLLILLYHFLTRVLPGIHNSWNQFEPEAMLPYLIALAVTIHSIKIFYGRNTAYDEFIKNSPGIDVDAQAMKYGVGHGFRKNDEP